MTRKTMKLLIGVAFAACIISVPGHLRAEVSVSESSNAVMCKGEGSCSWLKQACAAEGGAYLGGADATGKCDFPGKAGVKLANTRKLTPRKPVTASVLGQ